MFREDSDAWAVAPMHSIVHNLRAVAAAADEELLAAGRRSGKLADCGDQLRKCFSVSIQAPGERRAARARALLVSVPFKERVVVCPWRLHTGRYVLTGGYTWDLEACVLCVCLHARAVLAALPRVGCALLARLAVPPPLLLPV